MKNNCPVSHPRGNKTEVRVGFLRYGPSSSSSAELSELRNSPFFFIFIYKKRRNTIWKHITQAFVLYFIVCLLITEPTMNLLNTKCIFFLQQPKQSIITFSTSLSFNAKLSLDSSRTNFQMSCLIAGRSFRRPAKRFIVSNAASPSLSGSPGLNSKHIKDCSLKVYTLDWRIALCSWTYFKRFILSAKFETFLGF